MYIYIYVTKPTRNFKLTRPTTRPAVNSKPQLVITKPCTFAPSPSTLAPYPNPRTSNPQP